MVSAFINQLLNPVPAHEVQADSQQYRQQVAALINIERFAKRVEERPNYKPERGGLVLRSPACAHACAKCFMECAIAPERLRWWQAELEKFDGSSSMGSASNG
jgi:hypothetical protein